MTGSPYCWAERIAMYRRTLSAVGVAVLLCGSQRLKPQAPVSVNKLIDTMLEKENYEASHRGHYMYLSKEKSDRTNGHVWTEKVIETAVGKVHLLVAEDGRPLTEDRALAERERLSEIAAHPLKHSSLKMKAPREYR
jgi:hypothetical protein